MPVMKRNDDTQSCETTCDFRRVFENAGVGIAVYAPSGALVYANAQLSEMSGHDAAAFESVYSPLPGGASYLTGEVALFNAIVAGEQTYGNLHARMLRTDGVVLLLHIEHYSIVDSTSGSRWIIRQFSPYNAPERGTEPVVRSRRDKAYVALQLLTQVILTEFTLEGLMKGVHNVLRDLMPAESCSIALTNGPGSRIQFPYFHDICRPAPQPRDFGQGLTEFVYIWGKPFLLRRDEIEAMEKHGRICPASPRPAVWLGVPLRTHAGASVGVLAVRSYSDGDAYSPEDLKLLELISVYVGGAMQAFQHQEELRESEARFRAVFEHSGLGVCMVDQCLAFVESNRRVAEMIDARNSDLAGHSLLACIAEEQDQHAVMAQYAGLRSGATEHFTHTSEWLLPDGARFWCRQTYTAVRNAQGEFSFSVVLLEDVTEHKLADDRLMHMAFHDALTGLPNRSLFTDRLAGAVRRARRHADYHFAVLFMDMDRFKVVNDSMGHKAGDSLLVQFAERVRGCLRESDTFARFGGDEFAVLMDDFDEAFQAVHIVQRIRDAFVHPFKVNGVDVYSGASIGAVLRARDYERAEDILRDADAAMYRAKEGGAGNYEVFDRSLHTRMQGMLQMENAIRRGLEFSEFTQIFQPYVTLQSGRVRGAEVLTRWQQPGGEVISPESFIKTAEEGGLIFDLDCQMVEQGCTMLADMQRMEDMPRPMTLALNISATSLQRWNMVDVFSGIIRDSGCHPADICLEITENALLKGEDAVVQRLWKLKDMGLRIALDDFGTGYSSFNYLRQFPVDMIKIDRSFTATVHEDRAAYGIVQAIISLGRGLGMEVVAEGVETREQAQVLMELGCEAAQGYFFSKPVEKDRLFRLMQHGRLPLAAG